MIEKNEIEEDFEVFSLFPTGVYKKNIKNVSFSSQEIEKIKDMYFYIENAGNHTYTTKEFGSSSILDENLFLDLKKIIQKSIDYYVDNVLSWSNTNLKITSSWFNEINSDKQYHHQHSHPNSIVSGVFYLNTLQDDKIMFYRHDPKKNWTFKVKDYNTWNSLSWWMPVEKYILYIFPSYLEHSVPINEENDYKKNIRQSISFNTFFHNTETLENPTTYFGIS